MMMLALTKRNIERSFEHMGHECIVVLNETLWHRCGYVLVDDGSPFAEMRHGKVEEMLVVHGGVTFYGRVRVSGHAARWGIGFDCAHLGDVPDVEAARERYGIDGKDEDTLRYIEMLASPFGGNTLFASRHMWTEQDVVDELVSLSSQIAEHEERLGHVGEGE